MALSDYLTGDEWDACFYCSQGKHSAENFGVSMQKTIHFLISKGYSFRGLDGMGRKKTPVDNGVNAPKILIFLGNPRKIDIRSIMDNGRSFISKHAPELLSETDEEWNRAG